MEKKAIPIILAVAAFAITGCQNNISDDDVPDTTVPTIGTAISFTATSSTATTAIWGVAKDDVTEIAKLQYKVVQASAKTAIDTKEKADKIAGKDLVMNWTANVLRKSVTGLAASSAYYFAVLVRDESGNISLYAPKSVKTAQAADKTAPTVGKAISFAGTSATSTTVKWGPAKDDTTGAAKLQYKLVKAASSIAIDTIDEVNKISGANLVMDWAANTVNGSATGLTANTTYWFAVLVKDAAGNTSIYAPQQIKTSAVADTTAPTVGTAIAFSGTSASSTTVSWGAATDNVTPAASLQYKLVKANTAGDIDSIDEADAIAGGDLVMDWTANQLAESAGALTATTTYWFAVLVKDAAGNMSLYAPKQVTTTAAADTTAPNVGTAIAFSATAATSTTVSWGAATDAVTSQDNLRYKLVRASASTSIDTTEEVNDISGADLIMDWTAGDLTETVSGLSPLTTYWFAVLVKDGAGNASLYTPQSKQTAADTTAPSAGTVVSFSGTSVTGTTVSWGAASDNVTAMASLRYKLVRASTAAAIDSVAEADAVGGADLIMDWSTNTLTNAVTGLTGDTTYWFAVLVKDGANNLTLYASRSVTTLTAPDTTAPTVGTGIAFSGTTGSATTVNWGAANDNATAQASLQYKLVRASTSGAIDTKAEADAVGGADLIMDWTANDTSQQATGLSAGTTYWFAVLVKDASNNASLYAPQSVMTTGDTTPPTTGSAITATGISSSSMTISWGAATDNVTAASQLQYKLAYGPNTAAMDSIDEVNAITGAGLVMDWTTNVLTKAVTGLPTPEWPYYFSVLVRDAAGNINRYATKEVFTAEAPDTTPPTAGSAISFSGTSATSTTVHWGAGTDEVTVQASLQYKLVRASASTSIDTVAEVEAISGAALAMDWTAGTTSRTVTALTASTTYYFAALVRDSAGNKTLYAPRTVTTGAAPDTTPPTAGTAISFSGTGNTAATVNWGAATDNVTAQTSLQYKLVRATASTSIDTVAEANAISDASLVMDWTANVTSRAASGLTMGTTYYFAVVVRDGADNMTLYAPQSVTTTSTGNLMYNLNATPGWTTAGDWQHGTVTNVGPVGSVCYGTNISGNYANDRTWATNYVQTNALNFSSFAAATGFRMTFDAYFDVETSLDRASIQYSTDGTNFTTVLSAYVGGYTYIPSNSQEVNCWSPNQTSAGHEPAWRQVIIDLGGLGLNGRSAVYFRWVLSSDESDGKPGFYIDNIDIGY